MKQYLFLACFILPSLIQAQDVESYRSASNPYYWKNRKPYDGYWQQDVHYAIKASIDDATDIVDGLEELTYYNNSPDTLSVVYFHLYQNAFTRGAYLEQLNLANDFRQKFGPYEAKQLGTVIERIQVNGKDVQTWLDNTIYKVELPGPLLPNSSCTFSIKFKTYFDDGGTQRRRMKMFRDQWGNKQYDGVHWYPRICVYDRKFGWETDQHLGKEFYGDFGWYDVELTFPAKYVMDATGVLLNRDEVLPEGLRSKLDIKNFKDKVWESPPDTNLVAANGTKTWKFHAENVHDFAWVADPTFRIGEYVIALPNGHQVSCIALAQEQHAGGWQDAAQFTARVISIYSRDIGMYAYPKMIVADARDGMEYPMLTLDGGRSPGYFGLLAHEVGHNWFFGMVGNNETYRASLDEGFTQFLTHWSMSRLQPEVPTVRNKNPYIRRYYRPLPQREQTVYLGYIRDAINNEDAPLNTHSDDFNGALNHGGGYGHVYYKTATMLYNLQYVLGDELFLAALNHYFDQWKFCHPYFEDFRNSIISYTHVDLNWFFDQWLETTKTIDYSIESVKQHKGLTHYLGLKNGYVIKLKRNGSMQMPIDLHVKDVEGNSYTLLVPNGYYHKPVSDSHTFVLPIWKGWGVLNQTYSSNFALKAPLKSISIDTTFRLADVNLLNNSNKCPLLFTLDHQLRNPLDRKHYILKWRPDIWWNNYDGIKAGLHFNGNYMNQFHVFWLTAWYNTDALTNYKGASMSNETALINYSFSYKNRIHHKLDVLLKSRLLDGLALNQFGFEKTFRKNAFRGYFKSMYRESFSQLYYLPYFAVNEIAPGYFYTPTLWNENKWNNSLNLELDQHYGYSQGNGKITAGLRGTALGSDYDYAGIYVSHFNQHYTGRLEWRTRIFAQFISGKSIAPESMLYLAGANLEEQMENKFTRSSGPLPYEWFTYGAQSNHFHAGGGLNVRGYAGYLTPVQDGASQQYLFAGNSGTSANVELDYDGLFRVYSRLLSPFHLDAYLFADAGILGNNRISNNRDLPDLNTGLMASAGAGYALTIKEWLFFDEIRPLTIRFDMPLFLSNAPFADGDNLKFRWQLGINRAF